jgi:hypothetical protein
MHCAYCMLIPHCMHFAYMSDTICSILSTEFPHTTLHYYVCSLRLHAHFPLYSLYLPPICPPSDICPVPTTSPTAPMCSYIHQNATTFTHMHLHAPTWTHIHPYAPICTHMYLHVSTCTHMHLHVPTYTHMHPHTPICSYMHPHAHIRTCILLF